MSVRSDLDELRLKLAQLRLGLPGESFAQLNEIDGLAGGIAQTVRNMEDDKPRGLSWQIVVLLLGGLVVLAAAVWRLPDFAPPSRAIDRTGPATPSAVPPAPCPTGVDARSMDAVLDTLAKARSADGAASAATLSVGLLRDLVQGLMKAGTVTAETGGQLLKELQSEAIKRGGEITVEAAKALIDRFIRPHDEPRPPAPAASVAVAGAAVNVYCGFAPPPVAVRRPAPPAPLHPPACKRHEPPVNTCPDPAASAAG